MADLETPTPDTSGIRLAQTMWTGRQAATITLAEMEKHKKNCIYAIAAAFIVYGASLIIGFVGVIASVVVAIYFIYQFYFLNREMMRLQSAYEINQPIHKGI